MDYWQVRLKGKEPHIKDVSNLWVSAENSILKENEEWHLKSALFDKLTTALDVMNVATGIIEKVNDVFFFYQDSSPIEIDNVVRIDENGVPHHYDLLKFNVSAGNLRITASPSTSPHDETPRIINPVSSLYNIATTDKAVSDALHFYRKNDWVSLYKVYEIIRDDVGDIKKRNYEGISDKEINQFTGTAQSRSALGDNARHAAKKYSMPDPMKPHEAKKFIRTLIEKWCLQKA